MPYRRIYADLGSLLDGAKQVILDADAAAGASSVTVKSIVGIAVNNILLFREIGDEFAEIVAVHATTAPSGNIISLAAPLVEAHPAGTTIYVIPYNQVRFYRAATAVDANADDSTLTALVAATAIDPTTPRNYFDDSTYTSGSFYWRFINSVTSINGLYSDPIPYAAARPRYLRNEVGYMLEFVARKIGRDFDQKFSKDIAIDEINACLAYQQGKLKHWGRYLVSNYAVGQTSRGVFEFTLPTDIYDNQSNKSILNVRIGDNTRELIWKDEKEFDNLMGNAVRSTVRTLAVVGSTTLDLVNSYDFDASGTVHAFTSNTDDAITYTGVTRSVTLGVLTGVPATGAGAIGAAHAVGINVWQQHVEGEPLYFTVRAGSLLIWPLVDSTWINKNLFIDYYQEATVVDSEADTIDADRYDMVRHWLLWQAKNYWFNNGKEDMSDGDYVMFRDILSDQIRKAVSGQKFKMKPKINTIAYRSSRRGNFDNT